MKRGESLRLLAGTSFCLALTTGNVCTPAQAQSRRAPATQAAATDASSEPAKSAPATNVSGTIWLDSAQLAEGARTRVWVALENLSDSGGRSVQSLDVSVPGFKRIGSCWLDTTPACASPKATATGPPWALLPGSTLVVSAEIERDTDGAGEFSMSGAFTWSDGTTARQSAIAPLKVNVLGPRPLGFSPEWLGFLKDLILPVTLGLLAYVFQRVQQRRSDRQVVWASMLAKSHQNAEKYYMPIAAASEVLCARLYAARPWQAGTDFDPAMLPLLHVFRRMRELAKKIGGFYFKSRMGERITRQSWNIFQEESRLALPRAPLQSVLDVISPFVSVAELNAERAATPAFDASYVTIRTALSTWSTGSLAFSLLALELFTVVLEVEMNRPLELWYGEKEEIPLARIAALRAQLDGMKSTLTTQRAEALAQLQLYLDRYLESVSA